LRSSKRLSSDRQAGALVADDLDVVQLVAAVAREGRQYLALGRRECAPLDRTRRCPLLERADDLCAARPLEHAVGLQLFHDSRGGALGKVADPLVRERLEHLGVFSREHVHVLRPAPDDSEEDVR
jgi:hypothetical protein